MNAHFHLKQKVTSYVIHEYDSAQSENEMCKNEGPWRLSNVIFANINAVKLWFNIYIISTQSANCRIWMVYMRLYYNFRSKVVSIISMMYGKFLPYCIPTRSISKQISCELNNHERYESNPCIIRHWCIASECYLSVALNTH